MSTDETQPTATGQVAARIDPAVHREIIQLAARMERTQSWVIARLLKEAINARLQSATPDRSRAA